MMNNVDKLAKKLAPNTNKPPLKIIFLFLEDKKDEAYELANESLWTEIDALYKTNVGAKDFDKKLNKLINLYEPYYKGIGRDIPEHIRYITKDYIKFFGQHE